MQNALVANNQGSNGATSNCTALSGVGSFASGGFNLVFPGVSGDCGMSEGSNDLVGFDPHLGALQNNGGPIPTRALLTGSAAIDRGNFASPLDGQSGRCVDTDARGFGRPVNGDGAKGAQCDIGAFEAGGTQTGLFELTPSESTASVNDVVTFAFTWTVPAPENWHDLTSLDLRLIDQVGVGLTVHWVEASNSFSLGASSRATDLTGQAATLLGTAVGKGSGPTGPSVTLTIPIRLNLEADGRTFRIEVAAADDAGTTQDFQQAGTLTVGAAAAQPADDTSSRQHDDSKSKVQKRTDEQRQQAQRTNAGNLDDTHTEGNVMTLTCDASPPSVEIANRDGRIAILLIGEASTTCGSIAVGDYLDVSGEKQTEQLFEADGVTILHRR